MSELVLITGGAGFIGSHLADELLARGSRVRALDSLHPQVHDGRPDYLAGDVELHVGDVRDADAVKRAFDGVDVVVHLAARVGVGQSMYEIAEYTSANDVGTAVVLEALAERPVRKLLVASSMSIYGEGAYREGDPGERTREQLGRREWDFPGFTPVPTPETKRPALSSIYALNKYQQERACLVAGDAYGIPTVALRFFNAYGPRQALSNPYTGVLAIFASRLLNGRAPRIFEDGAQTRDFVSVHDVARACALALERDGADGRAVNVGSGRAISVRDLAAQLAATVGVDVEPELTGEFRLGDIRHCYADVSLARETLGYEPEVELADGMAELAGWLEGQTADDRVEEAARELARRGLSG
ncbi:MAG: NAD-dependent epimerase/dehydratase family protein [Actinobacteria bacterium]|nr:NAD-dependent epimerase/dehydratase family protein [Actinomycetota bacterium]MBV8479751.1 NAD-dependent epimerase/dehydratase family protein [Actinomycetota bacterium]